MRPPYGGLNGSLVLEAQSINMASGALRRDASRSAALFVLDRCADLSHYIRG